jgi:hypothetical protein
MTVTAVRINFTIGFKGIIAIPQKTSNSGHKRNIARALKSITPKFLNAKRIPSVTSITPQNIFPYFISLDFYV